MQTATAKIKSTVKNYITSEIVPDITALEDDQVLIDGRLIDSIGIMKIISFIESEYNVSLEDDDMVMANFQTLNNISDMIKRLIQNSK
jgi:acyl carrier protein